MKIMARTGMEIMPENCWECRNRCEHLEMTGDKRARLCPLVAIDETLPAQLECAEARIKKLIWLQETEDEA